jgi:hypothetical protein
MDDAPKLDYQTPQPPPRKSYAATLFTLAAFAAIAGPLFYTVDAPLSPSEWRAAYTKLYLCLAVAVALAFGGGVSVYRNRKP